MHSTKYIFSLFLSTISMARGLINYPLLKTIQQPNHLRRYLQSEMERNYVYIPYTRVREIMHNDLNQIDIYGDKEENMNVEHIFPQYMFKNHELKKIMKSDMHHLYLCNTKLNTCRQNFKYVGHNHVMNSVKEEDKSGIVLDMKGNRVTDPRDVFRNQGCLMMVNRKNKQFIPSSYSRGKIARSLIYFAVKYNYLDELKNVIDIRDLIEWNIEDPVTNDEYLKNILTYKYQKNLNPFILKPELVLYCLTDCVELKEDNLNSIYSKKCCSTIDPLHSIKYFIKDNEELEKENKRLKRILNKVKNMEI